MVVLAATGCTDDDDPSTPPTTDQTTSTSTDTTSSTSTSTTQPPGTDVEALAPVLEALIDRYDAAVAAILTDPRVAADRSSPQVATYLGLFVPDSTFPDTALQFWADEGDEGKFYRAGPRGQMYESTVQSIETTSADQVDFMVCSLSSLVVVDATGRELSSEGGATAGSVSAVRVDGSWQLRDLTRVPADDCPRPEAV